MSGGSATLRRDALIVEAEPALRQQLATLLTQWGYAPVAVESLDAARLALKRTKFALGLVNLEVNGADGSELLRELRRRDTPGGAIIVIVDAQNLKRIPEVEALGADYFIPKPFRAQELREVLGRIAQHRPEGAPGEDPTTKLETEIGLWRSPRMQGVWKVIEQAAQIDITVMITGETGTGKDLVARAIHHLSTRQRGPFVKVNCAAVPRELLESELFGHERGAFTGAHQLKIGKFEAAHHGTIFLDEIGDLHPGLQAKLLHVLQDGEFPRVGGKSTIKADVRIIAATNQELEAALAAGRFREDLYYRLNVIHIAVPPLRERPEEIPLLIDYFVQRYSQLYGRGGFAVAPEAMDRLINLTYQGNIRELENIVKRMIVLNDPWFARITLPRGRSDANENGDRQGSEAPPLSLKSIVREAALRAERQTISRVLEQTRWNRGQAAKLLNISYRALLYKIKHTGLEPKRSSARSIP